MNGTNLLLMSQAYLKQVRKLTEDSPIKKYIRAEGEPKSDPLYKAVCTAYGKLNETLAPRAIYVGETPENLKWDKKGTYLERANIFIGKIATDFFQGYIDRFDRQRKNPNQAIAKIMIASRLNLQYTWAQAGIINMKLGRTMLPKEAIKTLNQPPENICLTQDLMISLMFERHIAWDVENRKLIVKNPVLKDFTRDVRQMSLLTNYLENVNMFSNNKPTNRPPMLATYLDQKGGDASKKMKMRSLAALLPMQQSFLEENKTNPEYLMIIAARELVFSIMPLMDELARKGVGAIDDFEKIEGTLNKRTEEVITRLRNATEPINPKLCGIIANMIQEMSRRKNRKEKSKLQQVLEMWQQTSRNDRRFRNLVLIAYKELRERFVEYERMRMQR